MAHDDDIVMDDVVITNVVSDLLNDMVHNVAVADVVPVAKGGPGLVEQMEPMDHVEPSSSMADDDDDDDEDDDDDDAADDDDDEDDDAEDDNDEDDDEIQPNKPSPEPQPQLKAPAGHVAAVAFGCRLRGTDVGSWTGAYVVIQDFGTDVLTEALYNCGKVYTGHPKTMREAVGTYDAFATQEDWSPMDPEDLAKTCDIIITPSTVTHPPLIVLSAMATSSRKGLSVLKLPSSAKKPKANTAGLVCSVYVAAALATGALAIAAWQALYGPKVTIQRA
jgi:hypothetical protein